MIQLIKDVRLTFADKLGIFGGTIGVFTGISFITIIEILYWISLMFIDKCLRALQGNKLATAQIKVIDVAPIN